MYVRNYTTSASVTMT